MIKRAPVWTGPEGSGVVAPAWSPDGRLLAYAVDGDLVVRRDGAPDRLVVRGVVTEARPLAAFSPDGRWLAARTETGTVVVNLTTGGALAPDPIDTGVHCETDGLAWRGDAAELWLLCRGETPDLFAWDARRRTLRSFDDDDATALLGWRSAAPAGMLVAHDEVPALVGADGTVHAEPELASALGHVVGAAPAAGLTVWSDKDDDDGVTRTLWLAGGADQPAWPWLQGLVMGLSFTPDGAWAAFVVPQDSDSEGGDVYLARPGDRRVRPAFDAPASIDRAVGVMAGGDDDDGDD
ncbi:MAG TPA: hypothetical protein VL172_00175, partial [Kofleriaceae bacterium]|nr:hypothetical protein [Kofleriaceae bacterium]